VVANRVRPVLELMEQQLLHMNLEGKRMPVGVSVVIPVYNSDQSLSPLVEQLTTLFGQRGGSYEIILVNDGSRDGSWQVIQELAQRWPHLSGIDLMRNYGQHNALLCGIRQARYDTIVTMDDDLQHPPEEVPKLLAKLAEGHDVVYGTPEVMPHGFWRNFASTVTKIGLQSAMGVETARWVSAFRAFRTRIRDAFADCRSPHISIDVVLTWGSNRFSHQPVRHEARKMGVSNYTFWKLLVHTFHVMTAFSTFPLRLATILGFAATVFSLLLLVYVIGRYLVEGGSAPGFPFLASIISLFAGLQLFSMGIIGEYLARLFIRNLDKPTYVVGRRTSPEQSSDS
jgi:glycosyltransferase involved in cell wall biosynthesis